MALKRITLKDFVIVDEIEIELAEGFTALTGETGAGKSILVDAVQLALGARADVGVVREGAPRADICLEFDAKGADLTRWLDAMGIPYGDELLIRRVLDTQGKSRAWINGVPCTVGQLREVAEHLLEIHGQHAWQRLTKPESIKSLLDAYAKSDTTAMTAAWQTWRQALKSLEEARSRQSTLAQEQERLSWQINELDKLAPLHDEWASLNEQHAKLSNAQGLMETATAALEELEGDEDGLVARLARLQDRLQAYTAIEPAFREASELLASSLTQTEEISRALHGYLRRAELDPDQLETLNDRLGTWISLARRFRTPPQDIPSLLARWRSELDELHQVGDLEALERECDRHKAVFMGEAEKISKARTTAAPRLAKAITRAMQELGMKGGKFEVHLPPLPEPTAHGLEGVEFLVAGHAGSTPRPVGKVASGGELSRIALAIAVTTSQLGAANTLIFDEVDSGVGGAAAVTVGALMKQLGAERQVLAVTHLAQVAASAHHHLVVSKTLRQGQTRSQIQSMQGDERIAEIARMMGGTTPSETSLAHARELLGPSKGRS